MGKKGEHFKEDCRPIIIKYLQSSFTGKQEYVLFISLFLVFQEYEIDQKLGIKVRINESHWLSANATVESLFTELNMNMNIVYI